MSNDVTNLRWHLRVAGRASLALLLASALLACGDRDAAVDGDAANDSEGATLPAPEDAGGGVTGMPGAPGPGRIGTPPPLAASQTEPAVDIDGNPVLPAAATNDATGVPSAQDIADAAAYPATADGPGADQAVEVIRRYYEAVNTGHFGRAYALWSDGGNASGQSPQQFADGFDDTAEVTVEFMTPGRIEGAAGSRYIEVPVALRATRDDGGIHHYVGAYTLRRAVVDGATEEQRAWRISAADIREVQP